MITVSEANDIINQECKSPGIEKVNLEDANGRYLAQQIRADRDFPPFTRVSMDGIAIKFAAFAEGRRAFAIKGVQAAGDPPLTLEDPNSCLEVMTGAMIPIGSDTVIRYEDVEIKAEVATIQIEDVREKQNAHQQGLDRKADAVILEPGIRIGPGEIGVAATVGCEYLSVYRQPLIRIVATGDELVPVKQTPEPWQIRQSNMHSLRALLEQMGLEASIHHLTDDPEKLHTALKEMMPETDVFILSGGVSKGKFDYLPRIFEELGVHKHFHRIKQRPGKPFWFGKGPGGQLFFALPGNPVSSFMCNIRYVLPYFHRCITGAEPKAVYAQLTEDIKFKPDLTYFAQVKLAYAENGLLLASPVHGHGSGDLANLTLADGFIELPAGKELYTKGEAYRVWKYRDS